MTEKYTQQGNNPVYYTVAGSGDPVFLIHGFGEDSRIWDGLSKSLENDYTVVIPDLPGSGRSMAETTGITMDSLAESIKLILENEKISKCAMIGHSMGGYVTLAFAEKYPEWLDRLGLFHSSAFADDEDKKAMRKKNMEFITKHGSLKFLEQSVPKLFSGESNEKSPELIREIVQRYSNFPPSSLVHYTEAMMNRPERTEILKNFPRPVLFILGEYDTAVPLEQGLKQTYLPVISYIYVCTHSGHMGMLEEPEFCINAVKYFLSGK
jgi:pimeloyl-ACP methyl ester carboxylesterase